MKKNEQQNNFYLNIREIFFSGMSFSQTINIHTIIINNFAKFTFFFFFDQMKFWQKMCFGRSVCFFSSKINIFEQFHIKNDHYTLKCTKTRFFLNMYHFEFSRARHACMCAIINPGKFKFHWRSFFHFRNICNWKCIISHEKQNSGFFNGFQIFIIIII